MIFLCFRLQATVKKDGEESGVEMESDCAETYIKFICGDSLCSNSWQWSYCELRVEATESVNQRLFETIDVCTGSAEALLEYGGITPVGIRTSACDVGSIGDILYEIVQFCSALLELFFGIDAERRGTNAGT